MGLEQTISFFHFFGVYIMLSKICIPSKGGEQSKSLGATRTEYRIKLQSSGNIDHFPFILLGSVIVTNVNRNEKQTMTNMN